MSIPDLTQKVLGFRQFAVHDGGLCSIGVGRLHWLPGPNHARCAARLLHRSNRAMYLSGPVYHYSEPPPPPARHAAPAAGCQCGFYGLHEFNDDWLDGHMSSTGEGALVVVGAVLGWGTMEVHRSGYRSEWAEVVMLGYDPWIGVRKIAEVQEVARIYGVRAFDLERFVEEAPRMGERIPESLLPDSPKPPSAQPALPPGVYSSGGYVSPFASPLSGNTAVGPIGFVGGNVDQGADTEQRAPQTEMRRGSKSLLAIGAGALAFAIAEPILWGPWFAFATLVTAIAFALNLCFYLRLRPAG